MADQGNEGLLSPYLLAKRLQAAKPFVRGKVLDFGCGSGALAGLIAPAMYLGVDCDRASLEQAKLRYSSHSFATELPDISQKFETIVSLAVIEHVEDPVALLRSLSKHLEDLPSARLVITTPHPKVGWVHGLGSAIGLFSKHAAEEHKTLLDSQKLKTIGEKADLKLKSYSRFLFGVNQIVTYSRETA